MDTQRKHGDADGTRGGPRTVAGAGVVGVSTSGLSGLLGLSPSLAPPSEPAPVIITAEWPWDEPVSAILRFGGWSFEDAVYDIAVAERFGHLWAIWEDIQRTRAERERDRELAEVLWWRRQGCPVACPLCGAEDECGCAVS